jgi:hypothetical protein
MDEVTGVGDGVVDDDHDFQVAQDGEFEEPEVATDDDERGLDDAAIDDVTGIDAERRVPGLDEPLDES